MNVNVRVDNRYRRIANVTVFTVPVMIMCLAANIVMRMRDVYSFCLNSSGIMNVSAVHTTQDGFIDAVVSFINGNDSALGLMEDSAYDPQPVFSELDRQVLGDTRDLLDILLIAGLLLLAVSAVMYFLLIRWRVKDIFMRRFKAGLVLFIILEAAGAAAVCVTPLREALFGLFMPMDFPEGDNLVMILGPAFPAQAVIFEAAVGAVAMAAVGYLTWYVAGRKKMFRR